MPTIPACSRRSIAGVENHRRSRKPSGEAVREAPYMIVCSQWSVCSVTHTILAAPMDLVNLRMGVLLLLSCQRHH